MDTYVKSINIKKLFGRFNYRQEFNQGVNVLFGRNGRGKTTLLHILANALNGEFERFAFLNFESIQIQLSDSSNIWLRRYKDISETGSPESIIKVDINNGQIYRELSVSEIESSEPFVPSDGLDLSDGATSQRNNIVLLPTAYFPAFRSAIDILKSIFVKTNSRNEIGLYHTTTLVRFWLLPFVPTIDFPSLNEIEKKLSQASLLNQIEVQDNYLDTVNGLLEEKRIIVNEQIGNDSPTIEIMYSDNTRSKGLVALSSGERQIVTLLYAATEMDSDKLILIDEPEISLHVDWQRKLLRRMMNMSLKRQIIVCTHSPIIGADYLDSRMEVNLLPIGEDFYRSEDEEIPFL